MPVRALMIYSPGAGTEPEPVEPLLQALEKEGFDTTVCRHGKDDINSASRGMDILIAAGGDGTVTSTVTENSDRSVPVAILPLGGSNNVARALGIRQSPEEIIAGLAQASQRELTIGKVTGPFGSRLFLEAVGLGALNHSIEKVDESPDTPEEKRQNGRSAFRQSLADAPVFSCRVSIDHQHFEGPWLAIEILNISAIGPRLPFAPRADTGDGFLDVLLVKDTDREAMLAWSEHFSGPPPARIEIGQTVRLEGNGLCVRIDDRPLDLPEDGWMLSVEIDGAPASILVPRRGEITT